ncbi:MAG: PLP-dependent aminotransferase family protein [Spirochaetaceae bacterium]|nr:PLP-dependent aminotransferase family protein [Spirochaetaceae bacterium]
MREVHQLPPEVVPDRDSGVPLYRQVYRSLRAAILSGRLQPGTRLPATRAAALELGVARNTVVAVFEQLADEGFVSSRVGDGTRVAEVDAAVLRRSMRSSGSPIGAATGARTRARPGAEPGHAAQVGGASLSERGRALAGVERGSVAIGAFQTGLPDLAAFPHQAWARLLARHARAPAADRLGYGDAAGDPHLRAAIAGYVAAARGVNCTPAQVIVVTGAQAALDLAARMLLDPGDRAWIEEPGYPGARAALLAAGARIEPVPVDAAGMDVEAGETSCPGARLAYITPSCQYPVGSTLTLERRLLLLDWAQRAGAFVIEDDYDSEYRYRGRPIASVQGLDPHGRVVYVGTFAKTMLPALSVGYLVAPERLAGAFAAAVRNTGQTAPQPVQGALAEFIDSGRYGAHVRRMRNRYAQRQALLFSLAGKYLPGLVELAPTAAGMQVAAWLARGADDRAVAEAGRPAGLALRPLSPYWVGPRARPGLHLGYAAVSEEAMEPAVLRLRRHLVEHADPIGADLEAVAAGAPPSSGGDSGAGSGHAAPASS